MIGRDQTLEVLRSLKGEFSDRYGITALGIFGSVARGEEKATRRGCGGQNDQEAVYV